MSDNKLLISTVWEIQNKLRNSCGITGTDALYQIVIVLLARSLTKEKCRRFNIPEELSWEVISRLNSSDRYTKFYNPQNIRKCLFYYLRDTAKWGLTPDLPFRITKDNIDVFDYMVVLLDKIPLDMLESKIDIIGDIYEHFINREGKTMKDLGQYFTDRGLIEYIITLTKPKIKSDGMIESIWDPAAGTGGFLLEAIKYFKDNFDGLDWTIQKQNIYGGDINVLTHTLLKQNLYYAINDIFKNCIKQDGLAKNAPKDEFNIILMNPPFGVKGLKYTNMNPKIKELQINGTKGEILFLQNCMTHLAPGGRCAIVVPEGVLFNGTKMYRKTREYLLKNFELHKVIKVGDGEFFKNTGVKTSVLFFERTGNPTSKVSFIQVDKVEGCIVEKPLLDVDLSKIIENDYSLNMNLFREITFNVSKDFKVVKLGDIFELVKGTIQATKNIPGKYQLVSQSFKKTHNINTLDGENIFISGCRPVGKIYYYKGKCAFTSILYVLKPKCSTFNTKYIYYYLRFIENKISEYCQTGSANKSLDIKAFYKLPIPLPPLKIQTRIVEQLDNIYENEIANSKKIIEGLETSIQTIMHNTLYREDLTKYKIRELCKVKRGNLVDKSSNEEDNIYPYYAGKGLSGYVPSYKFEGECIMMNYRLSLGASRPCIYIKDGKYNCSRFSWVITNTSSHKMKYLFYYFNSNIIYDNLLQGSTILEINQKNLGRYKLNIPPLDIQKQILTQIEPKEALISALKNNITSAEQEAKDIMNQLFSKDPTEEQVKVNTEVTEVQLDSDMSEVVINNVDKEEIKKVVKKKLIVKKKKKNSVKINLVNK